MKDILRASAPIKHIVNDVELVPHTVDIEFGESGEIGYRKDDGDWRPFGGSGIEVVYETMPTTRDYVGKIVLYMGETTPSYNNKHFYLGSEDRFHVFNWIDVSEGGIKKVDTMEDPTAEHELVMYIGETTADYTYREGGIYESREIDGELVWVEQITEKESVYNITPDVTLAEGVTGQIMRHGNLIIFELRGSSEDDFIQVAEAMPKPFPGSTPLFTANAGTDSGYAAKMTVDPDGVLAFTDDEGFNEFSVSGCYFSKDFNESKGWALPAYEYIRDITEDCGVSTGITGYVHRLGNQIEFMFKCNSATAVVNLASGMPKPTGPVNPIFSAVTDHEASSLSANAELTASGVLHFLDTDGYKSFTIFGNYYSKDFDEYMGFDVNSSRIPLYSDTTKDIRFGQDEDGYYGYYEPDSEDIHAFRDEGIDEASVGEIRAFAGACYNNPPEGWLVCKGQSVLRSEYPDLFAVIRTTYGAEDDAHFTIPDLTNRFIQGGSADPDGQPIAAGVPNIKGWTSFDAVGVFQSSDSTGGCYVKDASPHAMKYGPSPSSVYNPNFDASKGQVMIDGATPQDVVYATGDEVVYGKSTTVQPPALKMVYLIRYKKVRVYEVPDFIDGSTVGEVKSYAGDILPRNWLLCDGHEELVEEYPELYAVIKNKFGTPSAAGKFKLPDLTNLFIEGGTFAQVGQTEDAGLPNITGQLYGERLALKNHISFSDTSALTSAAPSTGGYGGPASDGVGGNGYTITFNAERSNSIYGNSDTVQPPAVRLVYIIRARKVSIRNEEETVRAVNMSNDHTIEFGIDANGNWGYKKDGADSVIPFKAFNADYVCVWYGWYYGGGFYAAGMGYDCISGEVLEGVTEGSPVLLDNDYVKAQITRNSSTDYIQITAVKPIHIKTYYRNAANPITVSDEDLTAGQVFSRSRGGSQSYNSVYTMLITRL